jgi:hypothetical protein
MDDKIKKCVNIKFCMELCVSVMETLEMFCKYFGEHSLFQTEVFEWHSRFKAGRVLIEGEEHPG